MSLKAFDTADVTTGHAHAILAAGYQAVGIYLRADRAPAAMVEGLRSVGIKIFSIWEKGYPTSAAYFTAEQGKADGEAAAEYALLLKQPQGTTISPCVDYDSNPDDVKAYLIAFHDAIKIHGYHSLPYGNGATLQWAIDAGYAVGGFLSQSTGFQGYTEFKPKAKIVQGSTETVLGFDVDLDTVIDSTICW